MQQKELIMFYNVENLFLADVPGGDGRLSWVSGLKNWNSKRYENKLFKLAHVFELIKEEYQFLPLLVGVSEIQGERPLAELCKLEPINGLYGIVHYESLDERGVDVALLYDKSKIEILYSEPISFFFRFPDSQDRFDTTRDVLYVKIKVFEEVLHVFVMHLPSKRENDINLEKRNYILNEIKVRVEKLTATGEKVILMGDFNENPLESNITALEADQDGKQILFNPFKELYKSRSFSTFHNRNGLLFDQMLFSHNFIYDEKGLIFALAKVFNHQMLANWDRKFKGRPFRTYSGTRYLGGYSDHFPILTELLKK